jgi:molybdate transport system ATP-binding protein
LASTLTAHVRRHLVDVALELDLAAAPVTVLFGPSGAGKTTVLRCLAGLDRPEPGSQVRLDQQVWDGPGVHVPARRRRVGYLFQEHVLFPHLSVAANVAYGLHGRHRAHRATRVAEALAAAGAAHLAHRGVRDLSGGEAQRVALARALAPRPRLLLLDEPLSSLDTPARFRLRQDLRRLLLAAATPTIVVTHDRTEALALGDRIAVIVAGRLHQVGPIDEVFNRPATAEVAAAVGVETVAPGRVTCEEQGLVRVMVAGRTLLAARAGTEPAGAGPAVGESALVCIPAGDVALELPGPLRATSPRNHLPAVVTDVRPDGSLLRVTLDAGFPLAAYVTRPTREQLGLVPGSRVTAAIKAPAVHLIARGPDPA